MAKNNNWHLRMGCGEALCGALARQQAARPARQRLPAPVGKSRRPRQDRERSR